MRTSHYKIFIGILVAGLMFSSYLSYAYLHILINAPTPEVLEREGFRVYICDLQRQLGYSECLVDGAIVDFDDIDMSSPYFDD